MGIHGLTSFIDNNPHLLKDHRLHDCRIVIDGNNFYHFLYFYCNVKFQFGGDYDVYQRKISMIFSMFKSCNIDVFVVFDGAYSVDGRKFKTILSRARDRIFAAKRIMYGGRGTLIPCLAEQTFRQTLDMLGIPHVTCDFEADNQLVTLANLWKCPVISNDSDFYIFDLFGGFIPLDYIDFRLRQLSDIAESECTCAYLSVQYYHVTEFVKCFRSLNRTVLPLFATMLGNDYVDAKAFEAFYQKKTPKCASRRYSASKKHQKIVSVLYWLEEKEHKADLVSEVLTFIRPERQQKVKQLLNDSVNGYTVTSEFESFNLKTFLEGTSSAATEKTDFVKNSTGDHITAWFVTACRRGEVPVFLLNAALLHHVVLPVQVENISSLTPFLTSRSIREVIYGVLFGKKQPCHRLSEEKQEDQLSVQDSETALASNGLETKTENVDENVTVAGSELRRRVIEYTRHNQELWRVEMEQSLSLPKVGKIPSLEEVPSISQHIKQSILFEALGVSAEFFSRFEPSLQLYMACLVFWVQKSAPPVTLQHLKGILLSALLLHVHKEIAVRENGTCKVSKSESKDKKITKEVNTDREDDEIQENSAAETSSQLKIVSKETRPFWNSEAPDSYVKNSPQQNSVSRGCSIISIARTCSTTDNKVLEKVRDNLNKYYYDPVKISNKNPPDEEIFQRTAQFQACLVDANLLNKILQIPVPTPQPATLINGSFIYTIIHELSIRTNPDLFLSEMLVKGSVLHALFNSLCTEIIQEAGERMLAQQQKVQGTKCCRGKKKKKAYNPTSQDVSVSNKVLSAVDQYGPTVAIASCELSNRFEMLSLEGDS